jgi:hypothetical protein
MSNVDSRVKTVIILLKETKHQLTWDEYLNQFPLNSYERKLLLPYLDDNALINLTTQCMENSSYQPLGDLTLARHYDEALIGELMPMLIKRLKMRIAK